MPAGAPPAAVLEAFGAAGVPEPLAGGMGTSWRAGEIVLKPLDVSVEQLAWQADLVESAVFPDFRLARPVRETNGSFVVDGWTAWEALPGRHEEGRWGDVIAVGERLHAALEGSPCPDFIPARTDRWAIADRVAWGELPLDTAGPVKHLDRLASALLPVDAASQIVHGDLTGNVLFDDRLPPAVIDLSLVWRPTGYAAGIVVGDALVCEGADERLLAAVAHIEDFPQYLLRALIFRVVVDAIRRRGEPFRPDDDDPFLRPVELACRLAR